MLTTIFTAPEDYGLLMLRFQRITHSVVACRVVLQTKARLKGQQDGPLNDIHGDPGFDTATLEGQDK
ncbi:hypothetical protein P691DRAFT_170503 [Macrolepiota fuliginosa MF-IS2]|uniref:Uncharacterized protein n=1 Tax=Macrolepiota fuliginosa MF-IS2 TaxID=1400762 RepID=A0A9P5X8L5_9AGAR|nr:hypothetical protein P691DRAFT_170503 [Macrolepiota fuliginosa MF-IS2]